MEEAEKQQTRIGEIATELAAYPNDINTLFAQFDNACLPDMFFLFPTRLHFVGLAVVS